MSNDSVEVKVVRSSDGSINIDSSVNEYVDALNRLIEKETAEGDVFAEALGRVWSENTQEKSMQLDTLTSKTMSFIPGVTTEQYNAVSARLKSFIRNSQETYHLARGAKGGVQLLARLTPEELAKVEVQRAKAAAKKAA